MPFYDLSKQERANVVAKISEDIRIGLVGGDMTKSFAYYCDEDTYIRKSAYLSTGRLYIQNENLSAQILEFVQAAYKIADFKSRQTAINAAGEIGKTNFGIVRNFFDMGLFDGHHSVRNAVIGSVKKMGEVNPAPVLAWAQEYLHHPDREVRREICHGIELRGRKHPGDILPLLKQLQCDDTARVRNTLVHVIGQIAYKKGCLSIVVEELKTWENKGLVSKALGEIIDVHYRYRNFSALTQAEAVAYISQQVW
jgi:hypothetical protein